MYEGQYTWYRDLGFYTSRIFEHGKRRRVGICDDSSEPSLLPLVWMSRREDPSGIFNMLFIETARIFLFSSFMINFLFGVLKFIYIL